MSLFYYGIFYDKSKSKIPLINSGFLNVRCIVFQSNVLILASSLANKTTAFKPYSTITGGLANVFSSSNFLLSIF